MSSKYWKTLYDANDAGVCAINMPSYERARDSADTKDPNGSAGAWRIYIRYWPFATRDIEYAHTDVYAALKLHTCTF